MHAPLGNRQIAGYGVGDFAMNLYWSGTAFFLLYWYTDVAGLPNATAGFLFFVGSVWDAVTDPMMGVLAERTRTRLGRYRRNEAIVFGFTTFAQKVSIGIAGWILGHLLDATGYVSGAVQSAGTLDGLKFIMTLLPCALLGLGGVLIYRYPIDRTLHARMLADIESGQGDASAGARASRTIRP